MRIDFTGRTAFVSGSTQGIGRAIAAGPARSSATTVINGRSENSVGEALRALRNELPDASFKGVAADVATTEGARALADEVPGVDILVNNLGIFAAQAPRTPAGSRTPWPASSARSRPETAKTIDRPGL